MYKLQEAQLIQSRKNPEVTHGDTLYITKLLKDKERILKVERQK